MPVHSVSDQQRSVSAVLSTRVSCMRESSERVPETQDLSTDLYEQA